jgi:ribosomal protein S18 acetylase RimI-like enzyme
MSLRAFSLPQDLSVMSELIERSFQYPENESWSIQSDESEEIADMVSGFRRIFPLVRLLQVLSPPLRDVMRGYVWEIDGQPVGLVNASRSGATDQWLIGNVSVLPEFRRRGIARQLVQATVDYIRQRDGRQITLDVIDGNVPAYNLYQDLGFEHFSGQANLTYTAPETPAADTAPPEAPPAGYSIAPTTLRDWRLRYTLADRITPADVRRFAPVEERRFRAPAVVLLVEPLIMRAMGSRRAGFVVRREEDDQIVAVASIRARRRAGGINMLNIDLDPAHPLLAGWLVRAMVAEIERLSPGRRIEFQVKQWQKPAVDAALAMGFEKRCDMHTLGMIL